MKTDCNNSEVVDQIRLLYQALLGRDPDSGAIKNILAAPDLRSSSFFKLAISIVLSGEFLNRTLTHVHEVNHFFIHNARLKMVQMLLPPGEIILDLGGANAPLHRMGYPYSFKQLTLIDLPDKERHEIYGTLRVHDNSDHPNVKVHLCDMTNLELYEDKSVDFVWSGQSIEHVDEDRGKRLCSEAYRVLKPGGHFCLDTPNGLISKLHAKTAGLEFIHPEHYIEYTPSHLEKVLLNAGFRIEDAKGICHMPTTAKKKVFNYQDFVLGSSITDNINESYIQYYRCTKPK